VDRQGSGQKLSVFVATNNQTNSRRVESLAAVSPAKPESQKTKEAPFTAQKMDISGI